MTESIKDVKAEINDVITQELSLSDEDFKHQYFLKNQEWWRNFVINRKQYKWWKFSVKRKHKRIECNQCKTELSVITMRSLWGVNYCPDCFKERVELACEKSVSDTFRGTDLAKWEQRIINMKVTDSDLKRYNSFEPRDKFDLLLADE
tara:strand:+ start:7335 stop:7778 length:444 start_codon:yes stop_codon:yes gene_type:complete